MSIERENSVGAESGVETGGSERVLPSSRVKEVMASFSPLSNIESDLHLHSQISDGILVHDITELSLSLGLSDASITPHVRQRWDDIEFYNRDAYMITVPPLKRKEGGWSTEENIDVLPNLTNDWDKEFGDDFNFRYSFEQDYESWNEDIIYNFLENMDEKHRPSYLPLSFHYIPLEEWDKAKYFRLPDFEDLSDDQLARAAENYRDESIEKIHFGNRIEQEFGIRVVHTHLDGIFRVPGMRSDRVEEYLHQVLDVAKGNGAVVEVSGRVMRKLEEEYENHDEYEPEDASWFAREVDERAKNGDLEYVGNSDAHSIEGMAKNLHRLDEEIGRLESDPLNYEELLETVSDPQYGQDRAMAP